MIQVDFCLNCQVVGLDLVDDESKPERRPTKHMPTPAQWTNVFNPAYSYYVYYCYANLYTLNKVCSYLITFLSVTYQRPFTNISEYFSSEVVNHFSIIFLFLPWAYEFDANIYRRGFDAHE